MNMKVFQFMSLCFCPIFLLTHCLNCSHSHVHLQGGKKVDATSWLDKTLWHISDLLHLEMLSFLSSFFFFLEKHRC